MEEDEGRFTGKYIGHVRDTSDPESRGRLRLYVPEVYGRLDDTDHWSDWALPCFPWIAHEGVGATFIPPNNANWGVWVEFRQGDPRFPIWVGAFPMSSVDATRVVVTADTVFIGGTTGAQKLPRFETYRSAEDTLVNALNVLVTAINTFAGTCTTSPPSTPAITLSAAVAVFQVALSSFLAAAASYLATKGKVV